MASSPFILLVTVVLASFYTIASLECHQSRNRFQKEASPFPAPVSGCKFCARAKTSEGYVFGCVKDATCDAIGNDCMRFLSTGETACCCNDKERCNGGFGLQVPKIGYLLLALAVLMAHAQFL